MGEYLLVAAHVASCAYPPPQWPWEKGSGGLCSGDVEQLLGGPPPGLLVVARKGLGHIRLLQKRAKPATRVASPNKQIHVTRALANIWGTQTMILSDSVAYFKIEHTFAGDQIDPRWIWFTQRLPSGPLSWTGHSLKQNGLPIQCLPVANVRPKR